MAPKKISNRSTKAGKASLKRPVASKERTKRPLPEKKAPKKRAATKPKARERKASSRGLESHPGYLELIWRLRPGSYAGGLIVITTPGALDAELHDWLMGNMEGRRSIGRTAFGELLVFRDLRERARQLGGDPEREGDVALVDIHYKKMTVLGTSVETFLDGLDDPQFLDAFFRREMFSDALQRLGPCAKNECYGFVPALALGGSEEAESLQRVDWRVHQALLLQM